ncbi:hypothetical protein ACFX2I_016004 [Malus domestica]
MGGHSTSTGTLQTWQSICTESDHAFRVSQTRSAQYPFGRFLRIYPPHCPQCPPSSLPSIFHRALLFGSHDPYPNPATPSPHYIIQTNRNPACFALCGNTSSSFPSQNSKAKATLIPSSYFFTLLDFRFQKLFCLIFANSTVLLITTTALSRVYRESSEFVKMNYSSPPYIPTISISDQQHLLEKLQVFKIQGRDKHGRKVLRIVGKFFPARSVSNEAVNKYLEEKIFPKLGDKAFFSVVYVHTDVNRGDNFPGISTLRSIYEAIPTAVKDRLQAVYFLHPGLQAKLFLATFGRLLFTGGLYKKLKYVTRLEFLWVQVRRNEVEVPDFVYDYDEQLEYRPIMDFGLESDHPRVYGPSSFASSATSSMLDSPAVSMYSMRCIA